MRIKNWKRCKHLESNEVVCWRLDLKHLKGLLRKYSYKLVIETDNRKPKRYWLLLKRYRDLCLQDIEHILDETKLYEAKERAIHFMKHINTLDLIERWWYDEDLRQEERNVWYAYLNHRLL